MCTIVMLVPRVVMLASPNNLSGTLGEHKGNIIKVVEEGEKVRYFGAPFWLLWIIASK